MSLVRYIPMMGARLLTAALLLFGVSCVNDDLFDDGATAADPDDRIAVGATVDPDEQTRGLYVEEGDVSNGTYYLFYTPASATSSSTSGTHSMAIVDFGNEEGATTGFAYYMDGDTRKDLKWRDVYDEGKSSQYYYLCNVDPNLYSIYSTYWYYLKFNKSDVANPYVAGPLDEENGTNDILSSNYLSQSSSTGKKLNFTLYHRLSLLQINIEVYPSKEDNDFYVNLENAEVTISSLPTTVGAFSIYTPTSFSYYTSLPNYSNSYGASMNKATVTMVDPELKGSEEWDAHYWAVAGELDEEADDPAEAKKTYSTKRFVMPPYTISSTDLPVLSVKVPKRDVSGSNNDDGGYFIYSGRIPNIMFNSNGVPEAIALKSGTQLNITATIDSPNPNLIFAPVKVEKWVSKSSFTFKPKQAGIYNATDFQNMLELYKALQECEGDTALNLVNIERYGYIDANGHLVFQLWANLTFDKEEIEGIMEVTGDAPDFSFMFNGFTVTLTKSDDSGTGDQEPETEVLANSDGQLEFYNVLTGRDLQFKGIKSEEDFWYVMNLLNGSSSPTLTEVMQYGVMSNMDDSIIFDIEATFDLNIDEIYRILPAKIWEYDILFTIHDGHKVDVHIPAPVTQPEEGGGDDDDDDDLPEVEQPEDMIIKCEPGNYCPLSKLIPRATAGISSAEDFYFLVDCYNKYNEYKPELLELFGTKSGSSYTFNFLSAMTLEGRRAFVSMVPNTAENRPSYSISGSYTISFTDDKVPASTSNTSYIQSMLSGTGQARSSGSTAASNIVSYYNNNSYNNTNYYYLWYYGSFDFERNKWTFRLYYSSYYLYISYSSLFGKMIPDEGSGKYDYEFELSNTYYFYVQSMPNSAEAGASTSSHYFYQNGRDTYDYPNTAADLKRVADGTYWEYFEEWKREQEQEEVEP